MRAKPPFKGRLVELVEWTGSQSLNELAQDYLDELVGHRVAERFSQAYTIAFQIARRRQALVVVGQWLSKTRGCFSWSRGDLRAVQRLCTPGIAEFGRRALFVSSTDFPSRR
jgi:hypothetical protein